MIKYETPTIEAERFNAYDIIAASLQGEWIGDVEGNGDDRVIDDGTSLLKLSNLFFGG